ncbi:DnaJ domain - like 10 [Theobroma cacao]|uniref:Chaperone protein dnaJ 8, chloroplastic n=1 Tax=Theobroma cacao TaxID=3641 RepID=A0AB32UWD5_THECC|nr:PREDICTED: chaperone protein dnaJ 8, chloroplastic [Theobroma cacao]WRX30607.1 DnaJ domain - like 10 [Theobroma cacao]
MIGNGSSRLRLRGANHQQLTSTRRGLRIPIICRCFPNFTTHYALLGLTPFASKSDVKQAYKRLALKYHPDVYKGEDVPGKDKAFREIKSAYECLMQKYEADELQTEKDFDEYDDWEEWMGFEGGIPVTINPF